MQLGAYLHAAFQQRRAVVACAAIALVAALYTSGVIRLFPPGLHGRSNEIAAASTQVVVDTPDSRLSDLRANTYDMTSMTNRATMLGNVMGSEPVRVYIAARAGLAPEQIYAVAPVTTSVPRAYTEPGSEKRSSDILKSTNEYRLDVQANPAVPILNIYAQAPSAGEAERLANASVTGLRAYLADLAIRRSVPPNLRVRVQQLGSAHGDVINDGVGLQIALLTFVVAFVLGSCGLLLFNGVRQGWTLAAGAARGPSLEQLGARPGMRADGHEVT
jgi:hypothetical protein